MLKCSCKGKILIFVSVSRIKRKYTVLLEGLCGQVVGWGGVGCGGVGWGGCTLIHHKPFYCRTYYQYVSNTFISGENIRGRLNSL